MVAEADRGSRSRPTTLGFALTSVAGGGAEVVVLRWLEELDRRGHSSVLYTYASDQGGIRLPPKVRHVHLPRGGRVRQFVQLPVQLRRRVQKDGVDVLITGLTYTNVCGVLALRMFGRSRTSLVVTEHNLPTAYQPIVGRGGALQASIARRIYGRADAAIAVSHAVAGDLLGGYGLSSDRIFVLPNPVAAVRSKSSAEHPRGPLTVVFVGRLVPQKRPERLVETLSFLQRVHGVESRGVVIGSGPLEADLRNRAGEQDVRLEFAGWREPWTECAKDASCLLLPSDIEGFGNVLVEAARIGLPVVAASSALGVADAIVPGMTGELAWSTRAEDLAQAVLRASSARGRDIEAWLGHFSVENAVDGLLRVVEIVRSNSDD